MTDETEHEPTAALYPRFVAKLPPEQRPAEWERTARWLNSRSHKLCLSRDKWKRRAEAAEEALDAIKEIAQNSRITL